MISVVEKTKKDFVSMKLHKNDFYDRKGNTIFFMAKGWKKKNYIII